jgi:hypothetical protein
MFASSLFALDLQLQQPGPTAQWTATIDSQHHNYLATGSSLGAVESTHRIRSTTRWKFAGHPTRLYAPTLSDQIKVSQKNQI